MRRVTRRERVPAVLCVPALLLRAPAAPDSSAENDVLDRERPVFLHVQLREPPRDEVVPALEEEAVFAAEIEGEGGRSDTVVSGLVCIRPEIREAALAAQRVRKPEIGVQRIEPLARLDELAVLRAGTGEEVHN